MKHLIIAGSLALSGCVTVPDGMARPVGASETCTASVYWEGFGRPLADGKIHSHHEIIVAMPKPARLGSVVLITNPRNGRSIRPTVADRGPAPRLHRCVDLSLGAAAALGIGRTIAPVRIDPVH